MKRETFLTGCCCCLLSILLGLASNELFVPADAFEIAPKASCRRTNSQDRKSWPVCHSKHVGLAPRKTLLQAKEGRFSGEEDPIIQDPKAERGPKAGEKKTTRTETTNELSRKRTWNESYALLLEYYDEHGHANVPRNFREDPTLGSWLGEQRARRSSLPPDRIEKLDALNLTWDGANKVKYDQRWEAMFQCLKEYKDVTGDCLVPKRYEPNQKLANWVYTQRRSKTLGKIQPDRFKRLEAIDFVWRLNPFGNRTSDKWEDKWERKFEELLEYREENGHCRVPQLFKENQDLALWVSVQKSWQVEGRLRPDRKARLDAVGFTWDFEEIFDEAWMSKFNQLIQLQTEEKQKRGLDGKTWATFSQQQELWKWENNQQAFYKRGTMDPQRESMLDEIGYWDSLGLTAARSSNSTKNAPRA